MKEWKWNIGDIINCGRNAVLVIVGRKEEECEGGTQRFYGYYPITTSFGNISTTTIIIWTPEIVLETIKKMLEKNE